MFRLLRSDEIECRVGIVKQNGFSLLLYKDARCDMRLLDEEVGPMNWQKTYSRDNANCIVSIWDKEKGQWISKEDTGTESKTEAEKGLASDSFKRACVNWGIGRELYTAPFIWIPGDKSKVKYRVSEIGYTEGNISSLTIVDPQGTVVFTYGQKAKKAPTTQTTTQATDDRAGRIRGLLEILKKEGIDPEFVAKSCHKATLGEITEDQYNFILGNLPKLKAAYRGA